MRVANPLAAAAVLLAASGAALAQPAGPRAAAEARDAGAAPSVDLIAGGRMMTENGLLALYTPNPTPPNGLVRPGPYMAASRKKTPVGRIGAAGEGVYYRCKFAYTNWYQGSGHSLRTTAVGARGDSLLKVASVASVMPGDAVSGVGVPPGDTIETVTAGSVWLSRPLIATLNNSPVTIASRPASYGANAGELFDAGGAISVTAGVRAVFGDTLRPPLPVRFDGQTVANIPPGKTVWSDWVEVAATPGTALEADTTVYWPRGAYVFAGHVAREDLGEDNALFGALRSLLGGPDDPSLQAKPFWRDPFTAGAYGPANMICSTRAPAAGHQSLVIVGDSNAVGTDDTRTYNPEVKAYVDIGDADGFVGPWERAAKALGIAHVTDAQPGKRLADLLTSSQLLLSLVGEGPSFVVLQLGLNDLGGGGASAATVEDAWIRAVKLLQQGGRKVIATTVGPETTTTDGGATTANQTPAAGFAVGGAAQAFNDWIRSTGAPTYTGGRLVDVADIVMSARDSQVFRTDIAPFADWYGYVVGMSWWPGVGGAPGVYDIAATGGACAVEPAVRVSIVKGSIDRVILTQAGRGCAGAPSLDMSVVPGFHDATLVLRVAPLQRGVHYHTGYDYTHATFSALGVQVSGARLVDAHAAIAAAIEGQLRSAMAK